MEVVCVVHLNSIRSKYFGGTAFLVMVVSTGLLSFKELVWEGGGIVSYQTVVCA